MRVRGAVTWSVIASSILLGLLAECQDQAAANGTAAADASASPPPPGPITGGGSHSIGQAVREHRRLPIRSRRGQSHAQPYSSAAHRKHDQDGLEKPAVKPDAATPLHGRPKLPEERYGLEGGLDPLVHQGTSTASTPTLNRAKLPGERYGLEDLLVVMPTTHDRLALVEAGRVWRKGMKAYIVLDKPLERAQASASLLAGMDEYQETYGHFGDIHNARIWSQPGDARAALAPFRANKTLGLDSYKWILYGDDDTIWFPENVLKLVNGLDHTMPYFLTDHIWFPEWKGVGEALNRFVAVKACPCTLEALCKGADNAHIINSWDCRFTKWRPAWWYFAHGGAGAVLSSGLMKRASYSEVENKIWNQRGFSSGDSAFTDVIWDKMRVLPTDPGPGYYRRHVRLFDPGWRGPQAKSGQQDQGTEDWGNDPPGLIVRLEEALAGTASAQTVEAMDWVVTSHIRSRFSNADVSPEKVEAMCAVQPVLNATDESLRPAAYMHFRVGELGMQYAEMKRKQSTPQ